MDSRRPYRVRSVDQVLDRLTDAFPATMLVGPRATGKSTTLARRANSVFRLDRAEDRTLFEVDADSALRGAAEPMLLDEWQLVPDVLGAIRRSVDTDPSANRFIIAGSADPQTSSESWPGTGRIVRTHLWPMSIREQLGHLDRPTLLQQVVEDGGIQLDAPAEVPDIRGYLELVERSGFPFPALELDAPSRIDWLESYVEQVTTRDVLQVRPVLPGERQVVDSTRLRRYLQALAASSAGVVEQATILEAAGVSKSTARRYDALLQAVYVSTPSPAWFTNRLQRLVQREKQYIVDAALMMAILEADATAVLRDGDLLGRVLDTFVAAQVRAEAESLAGRPRLHHVRTKQGRQEVDLVLELRGGDVIGIEVKASSSVSMADARHLLWLQRELGPRFRAGVVLHTGRRVLPLADGIWAAPIAALWS